MATCRRNAGHSGEKQLGELQLDWEQSPCSHQMDKSYSRSVSRGWEEHIEMVNGLEHLEPEEWISTHHKPCHEPWPQSMCCPLCMGCSYWISLPHKSARHSSKVPFLKTQCVSPPYPIAFTQSTWSVGSLLCCRPLCSDSHLSLPILSACFYRYFLGEESKAHGFYMTCLLRLCLNHLCVTNPLYQVNAQ